MTSPPPPHTPQLPSRRMGAVLAALMLAAGIALGALIGPGPAASLASTSRAAAVGRVLALLALGGGTGSGSNLLLSADAAHPPTQAPQPTPPSSSEATAAAGGASSGTGGGAGRVAPGAGSSSSASPTSSTHTHPSGSVSPTSSTTPGAGGGGAAKPKTPAALPPIANVWLVVLPPGGSLANAPGQSTTTPYLDGQLESQGTVLSGYSSLAAEQLAGAATLLSGQVGASVSTISTPPPASGGPPSPQAADAFLQEMVPKIMASASYREHGLIVITFGAANPPASSQGAATEPSAGTTETAGAEAAYPAGTPTSTLTAGAPTGALLLSPFLRHVGARNANTLNPAAPRASLEALFKTKAPRA